MRKSYTGIKLDEAHPITGEKKYWVPHLRVRPAFGHSNFRGWLLAVVDSGSPYCLFRADIATAIGIKDITTGKPSEIGGVKAGTTDTIYFHKIKLYIESEWVISVNAGFTKNLSVAALLGRYGFFDQFFVRFDHSVSPPFVEVTKIDKPQ